MTDDQLLTSLFLFFGVIVLPFAIVLDHEIRARRRDRQRGDIYQSAYAQKVRASVNAQKRGF